MPLPTCQCNAGLPVQQQLANIYCALYTLNASGLLTIPVLISQGGTSATNGSDAMDNLLASTRNHELAFQVTSPNALGFNNVAVASFQNNNNIAPSAVRWISTEGNEQGAIGYCNSGQQPIWAGKNFLECSNIGPGPNNTIVALGKAKPFVFALTGDYGGFHTFYVWGVTEDGEFRIYNKDLDDETPENYVDIVVSSTGVSTFTAVGTAPGFKFNKEVRTTVVVGGGDGGFILLNTAGARCAGLYATTGDDKCYIDLAINGTGMQTVNAGRNTLLHAFLDNGDFETLVTGTGFVMKSPNGSRWRLTVSNAGVVGATAL